MSVSEYAGKRLYATIDENYRKHGKRTYKSLDLILKNPGITYENYRRRDGSRKYLAEEVKRGNAVAR